MSLSVCQDSFAIQNVSNKCETLARMVIPQKQDLEHHGTLKTPRKKLHVNVKQDQFKLTISISDHLIKSGISIMQSTSHPTHQIDGFSWPTSHFKEKDISLIED